MIPFELKLILLMGVIAIIAELIRGYREKKRKRQERLIRIKW